MIIDRFYVDLDDTRVEDIKRDLFTIFKKYPDAIIEMFDSGTFNHKTLVVRDINTTIDEAIKCIVLTHCDTDYISLVKMRRAFFLRISAKYEMLYNDSGEKVGSIITDKPELVAVFSCEHLLGDYRQIRVHWIKEHMIKKDLSLVEV